MKSLTRYLLLLCIIVQSSQAEELKPLKVAFSDIDLFPHEFMQDGEFIGTHVELISHVAKQMGYEVIPVRMPFARLVRSIDTGQVDAVSYTFGFKNTDHQIWLHDNNGLSSNSFYVITRKDSDLKFKGDINSLVDLRVGVIRGYRYAREQKLPFEIVEADRYQQILDLVIAKRVDAAVLPRGSFSLTGLKEMGLKRYSRIMSFQYNHVGFSKLKFDEQFSIDFSKKVLLFFDSRDWGIMTRKYNKMAKTRNK